MDIMFVNIDIGVVFYDNMEQFFLLIIVLLYSNKNNVYFSYY